MSGTAKPSTLEELKARARNAGLTLSDAQIADIYPGYLHISAMAKRVRRSDGRPREAEPAHIFRARFED
jgi:hypothetical protein